MAPEWRHPLLAEWSMKTAAATVFARLKVPAQDGEAHAARAFPASRLHLAIAHTLYRHFCTAGVVGWSCGLE
jgi:hypothetical protein